MIRGGVVTRHDPRRGTPTPPRPTAGSTSATNAMQMPRGRVYLTTMHGGLQCICPAMHGGGAKRRVKFEICFKFGLKIKKNSDGCGRGHGPRRSGHREAQHRLEVCDAADIGSHVGV